MGNTIQNKQLPAQQINHEIWIKTQPMSNRNGSSFANYQTLMNKHTGQKMDRYEVSFANQKQQFIYKCSCSKRAASKYLVKVHHFNKVVMDYLCGSSLRYQVYIEHCPISLQQISRISAHQYVNVLWTCFNGFAQLFEQVGYFDISPHLILFNQLSQCKVWINRNLVSINSEVKKCGIKTKTERSMVKSVIEILQEKLQQGDNFTKFSQFISKQCPYATNNFKSARLCLKQYSRHIGIKINQQYLSIQALSSKTIYAQDQKRSVNKLNLSKSKSKTKAQFIQNKTVKAKTHKILSTGEIGQENIEKVQMRVSQLKRVKQLCKIGNISLDQSKVVKMTWKKNPYTNQDSKQNHFYSTHSSSGMQFFESLGGRKKGQNCKSGYKNERISNKKNQKQIKREKSISLKKNNQVKLQNLENLHGHKLTHKKDGTRSIIGINKLQQMNRSIKDLSKKLYCRKLSQQPLFNHSIIKT